MELDKKHIAAMRRSGFDDEQVALALGVAVSDLPPVAGAAAGGAFKDLSVDEIEDEILAIGTDPDTHASIRLKALQYLHAEKHGRNVTAVTQSAVATEQQNAVIININGAVREALSFRQAFQARKLGASDQPERLIRAEQVTPSTEQEVTDISASILAAEVLPAQPVTEAAI